MTSPSGEISRASVCVLAVEPVDPGSATLNFNEPHSPVPVPAGAFSSKSLVCVVSVPLGAGKLKVKFLVIAPVDNLPLVEPNQYSKTPLNEPPITICLSEVFVASRPPRAIDKALLPQSAL